MGIVRTPELAKAIEDVLAFGTSRKHRDGLAIKIVPIIFKTIYKGLLLDGKVVIPGFGTFSTYICPAHHIFSNYKKEYVPVPERVKVRFRASDSLKRSMRDDE